MRLQQLLSLREFETSISWQVIYEWEDEIADRLGLEILNRQVLDQSYLEWKKTSAKEYKILSGLKLIRKSRLKDQSIPRTSICFLMHPRISQGIAQYKKTVPVFIDFWNLENIELLREAYKECPYLLITSLEALEFFKTHHFKNKLIHFPICLASQYRLAPNQVFDKKYDIALIGRQNLVLSSYLEQYTILNPELEIITRIEQNGQFYIKSNKTGILGNIQSRESYMDFFRASRVAFYCTPGIDGGENRTHGFNPVTPRLFEILSAGCHVISRYATNSDTQFFDLESICPSIENYEQFEFQLNKALNAEQPIKRNSKYLSKHYTSERIPILKSL